MLIATEQKTITDADKTRLEAMANSLRAAGRPYDGLVGDVEQLLASARVVPTTEVDPDVVTLDSRVRMRDLGTDTTEVVTLVERSEIGGLDGSVSVLTPLGSALLGSRVGDVVEWTFRWGAVPVEIEEVLYQPEAAGRPEFYQ